MEKPKDNIIFKRVTCPECGEDKLLVWASNINDPLCYSCEAVCLGCGACTPEWINIHAHRTENQVVLLLCDYVVSAEAANAEWVAEALMDDSPVYPGEGRMMKPTGSVAIMCRRQPVCLAAMGFEKEDIERWAKKAKPPAHLQPDEWKGVLL